MSASDDSPDGPGDGPGRGEVWWASMREPVGSEPGLRRPVVVISSDEFNRSRIRTVLVAAVTGNLALAEAPGNVTVDALESGLPRDSVVNVSKVATLDKVSSEIASAPWTPGPCSRSTRA